MYTNRSDITLQYNIVKYTIYIYVYDDVYIYMYMYVY
jgi:hypothetical protein